MTQVSKFQNRGNQTITFYAKGKRNKVPLMTKILHFFGIIVFFRIINDANLPRADAMPISKGNY